METVNFELIENKELRDQLISRLEVLDKVKTLALIPKFDCMTTKQVADYFEVDIDAIRRIYQRHNDEINPDGVIVIKPKDVKDEFSDCNAENNGLNNVFSPLSQNKTGVVFEIKNGDTVEVNNRGTRAFSKRAILRIAMLLRDSEIAKRIRTMLLDTFEQATDEQILAPIYDEDEIMRNYGKAVLLGTKQEVVEASKQAFNYLHKQNEQLAKEYASLDSLTKMLVKAVNTWSPRSILNALIRAIGSYRPYSGQFGLAWNVFYRRLKYRYGIDLYARNENAPLEAVKDDEWDCLYETVAGMCYEHNIDVEKYVGKENMHVMHLK